MNYEKDIRIDETALDVEWLEQASLALKYARHLSNLKADVRQLDELKKVTRSELILKVNKDPEKLIGKKSPNANDIEAFYRSQSAYVEVVDELLAAQQELEYAELAYQEIAWTRKKALENLVVLHGQQYFAGPKMPRDLSQEKQRRESQQKEIDAGVASKFKRKK